LHETTAFRLEKIPVLGLDVVIHCDTSAARPHPYVSAALWRQVFNTLHGIGHLGTRASAKLITQRFVWPGVQKDCRRAEHACLARDRRYPGTLPHLWETCSPYIPVPARSRHHWPTPDIRRFQILPYGSRPLYTLAGSHSPVKHHNRDGSQSPAVRMDNSLRLPAKITNDQGRQFGSQLFHSLATMCGIHLSGSTGFHLADNGLVE
jgi:cleavage and polyadenylation specificity factor subunit 1